MKVLTNETLSCPNSFLICDQLWVNRVLTHKLHCLRWYSCKAQCGSNTKDKSRSEIFRSQSFFLATCCDVIYPYLVMEGNVTSSPTFMAALRLWAPTVSIAMMGTSPQPARRRPSTTPFKRPPPPTDKTTAPGFTSSWDSSSLTRVVCPSLKTQMYLIHQCRSLVCYWFVN